MAEEDVQKNWDEFWRGIFVEQTSDGAVHMVEHHEVFNQVKKELSDYRFMMQNTSAVFCDLTGGRISKPNTVAACVIGEADEIRQENTKRDIEDWIESIENREMTTNEMIANLKESFNIVDND